MLKQIAVQHLNSIIYVPIEKGRAFFEKALPLLDEALKGLAVAQCYLRLM